MTDEKWQQISDMIEEKFEVEEHGTEDLDPGTSEYYIFDGPAGRMKLERTIRPKLEDTKVHAAKRIGAVNEEEMIYSENEEVSFMKAYTWEEDTLTWVKMDDELISNL